MAGRLLNSKALRESEAYLAQIASTSACDEADRQHIVTVLGALTACRSIAASALTQAPAPDAPLEGPPALRITPAN